MGKATDFRYNTGATKVPWAAVGENYNVHDLMEIIKFLMQGEGKEYDDALEAVWQQVKKLDELATPPGKLSLGSKVEAAEEACNEYLGTDTSTFVTNATAGFEIAYKYANLKPGDEVIVPAITFVATMAYPLAVGAKLVFADVDPKTINMDPADVARKITDKTKMIVPVHIGGYPVDMEPIMKLAKEHDIIVLEDAAHAFGAMYKGKKIGTIGDFAAFSMHEVKNITSFGEGGIATTNIPGFGPEMKRARFLGLDFSCPIKDWLYNITPIQGKYEPFVPGNASTTEIQGLGLTLQVARNEEIIDIRRRAAQYLTDRFAGNDAIIPQDMGNDEIKPTFHLYLLQIDPAKAGGDIQALKKKLEAKGVTQIAHFGPLYRFKIVQDMGYDSDEIAKECPVCEEVFYKRFTHLPLYGLSDEQLEYMADAVYIATPVFCHKEQAFAAAKAGKHILLEKPMGLTIEDSMEIANVCKENGVKLGVGLMMRFSAYHQKMKELIENGALGDIVSMRAQLTCWYPEIPGNWRQNKALSGGGALMDMGIHCIDLLQYISGTKAEKVTCFAGNQTFNYSADDSAALLMKMDNGATAYVDANFNIPDNAARCRIEFYGTKGTIIVDNTSPTFTLFLDEEEGHTFGGKLEGIGEKDIQHLIPVSINNHNVTEEHKQFYDSIVNGTPLVATAREGAKTVAVCRAAIESSTTGTPVKVDYSFCE